MARHAVSFWVIPPFFSMLQKLQTAHQHRIILLEAFLWLGISRLVVLVLPFRWIEPYLGQRMAESALDALPQNPQQLRQVAWAVNTVSRYTPWQSKCLMRAMAAKRMLQSRQIVSTLYLGVRRHHSETLEAHAWLRSGPIYLTGGQGHKHFSVVATFAEKS